MSDFSYLCVKVKTKAKLCVSGDTEMSVAIRICFSKEFPIYRSSLVSIVEFWTLIIGVVFCSNPFYFRFITDCKYIFKKLYI